MPYICTRRYSLKLSVFFPPDFSTEAKQNKTKTPTCCPFKKGIKCSTMNRRHERVTRHTNFMHRQWTDFGRKEPDWEFNGTQPLDYSHTNSPWMKDKNFYRNGLS